MQLLSEHNLRVLVRLCERARVAIMAGAFDEFVDEVRARRTATDDEREHNRERWHHLSAGLRSHRLHAVHDLQSAAARQEGPGAAAAHGQEGRRGPHRRRAVRHSPQGRRRLCGPRDRRPHQGPLSAPRHPRDRERRRRRRRRRGRVRRRGLRRGRVRRRDRQPKRATNPKTKTATKMATKMATRPTMERTTSPPRAPRATNPPPPRRSTSPPTTSRRRSPQSRRRAPEAERHRNGPAGVAEGRGGRASQMPSRRAPRRSTPEPAEQPRRGRRGGRPTLAASLGFQGLASPERMLARTGLETGA